MTCCSIIKAEGATEEGYDDFFKQGLIARLAKWVIEGSKGNGHTNGSGGGTEVLMASTSPKALIQILGPR
jgi:hypothetical protein